MRRFCTSASTLVIAVAGLAAAPALAQSVGTTEFDQPEIVVTGTNANNGVDGFVTPNTSKARAVLTPEIIQKQRPGQSVDEIINLLPGVSFQNNDPYGSSGGTLTIRGFDASRISQTFDGIPLNDTGNYAIYSNQQLDPELIDRISVSLGSTDIDSPTASATGSTVNYTTRQPSDEFHARSQISAGQFDYMRLFGVIDTGVFTPFGTKAWFSGSHSENTNPFNERSKVSKYQYNAKIYQPLGASGDFLSLAGHYNRNRNNNFSSVPLRTDDTVIVSNKDGTVTVTPRTVGSAATNRFPTSKEEREYSQARCSTDEPQAGVKDVANSCGSQYDYSFNPSDTWNVRGQSRFTLTDGLVLTVEPSYQSTKANGGSGSVLGYEYGFTRAAAGTTSAITDPLIGYIGGSPYIGKDLNGDGDSLDQVRLYAPSHTETHRWIVLSSLRYDFSDTQTVRLSYTYDHGRHRQTGEVGFLNGDGHAKNYFPKDDPISDVNGNIIEKRNRLSYAVLNQVSGEYRGQFFDNRLTINGGVRAPFFKRDLNNYCITEGPNGFIDCFNGNDAGTAAYLAANPSYKAPQNKVFKYDKVLPSAGLVFDLTNRFSLFGNYSKGLQVPGTDNLYNSFGVAAGADAAKPSPETTDNFDGGVRYRSGKIQAQVSGWYTNYKNRLASAYDPILDITIYRNLGTVHKYGVDGSIAYTPIPEITLYTFGSYLKSEIQDNVQTGENAAGPIFAMTKGKRESGAPTYTFGGRAEGNFGPIEIGIQAKRTGPRYVNDQNLPVGQSYTLYNADGTTNSTVSYLVYGAKTPSYTLVDLDARISLKPLGLNDQTFLQLNITNLFNKFFVAGFGGNVSNTSVPNAYIGSPRAISGTVNFAF